jgi:hypothetical protein
MLPLYPGIRSICRLDFELSLGRKKPVKFMAALQPEKLFLYEFIKVMKDYENI